MRKYTITVLILATALISLSWTYYKGWENSRKDIGLIEFHFKVIDASTEEDLGRFYSFGFSGSGFTEVQRHSEEFSVFYTISDRPVTVEIGKEGYLSQLIEVQPITKGAGGGPLPLNPVVIRLEPENN